jgi:hypothetical protein
MLLVLLVLLMLLMLMLSMPRDSTTEFGHHLFIIFFHRVEGLSSFSGIAATRGCSSRDRGDATFLLG